ncbi:MAG: TonB-dependent receptor [Sphingomonadaceae bacterium]
MRKINRLFTSAASMVLASAIAAPAFAQQAPAGDDEAVAGELVVYGKGETRQVQTLNADDIAEAPAGTSALKVLEKLPSVSFQSANGLGTNEWSTRITVRGFNQNQLGFTLDGVPLGDMSYGNFNGLHISRAISSENLGRSTLNQGAGALDTASSSNLGGTLEFYSRTPTDDFGVDLQGSFGSESAYRLFGRLDTGDMGAGVKGYVSLVRIDAPKWKGQGKQEAWQINSKLTMPLGEKGSLSAFFNYSNFKDDDYMDTSPYLISKYGWDWDYIRNDYPTALAIASNLQSDLVNYSHYCENYPGYSQTICADDTYYDGYGLRKDYLMGANLNVDITDAVSLELTPYYHSNRGLGTWWTPYVPTPGGASLSVRSTTYDIERRGLTGALTFKFGNNELKVGGWYEDNDHTLARYHYPLAAGTTSSIKPHEWPTNPFSMPFRYFMNFKTSQYFVQDTWQVTDAFKITAGFKGLSVSIDNVYDVSSTSSLAARDTTGKLKSRDMFLPQVGVNYQLSSGIEAFASYAENMRAFTTQPFTTNRAGFQAIQNTIKPETSWTVEGGLRFNLGGFKGSLAGYHVKFSDRQLAVQPCQIVVGCASILSNVGSVTTNGFELAGTYKLTSALSFFTSYSYTDAKYDQDVLSGQVWATKGKQVVDTPKHLFNAELSYDDGHFMGKIAANVQSKRYYTYINDNYVDGRTLVDAMIGYRFGDGDSALSGVEVQVNATNLFDKRYIATLGQNGLTFSDPGGFLQSMLVGAPQQFYVSLRKRF